MKKLFDLHYFSLFSFDFLQQKKYIDGETIILFTDGNDNKCILSMIPSIHKC